jgi:hypothetical protein
VLETGKTSIKIPRDLTHFVKSLGEVLSVYRWFAGVGIMGKLAG